MTNLVPEALLLGHAVPGELGCGGVKSQPSPAQSNTIKWSGMGSSMGC